MKKWTYIFLMFLALFSTNLLARPAGGGGDSAGVKNACEISGGTFTGSESGNWACCWADWGCYGCVDGNCKVKCNTQRCKDANQVKLPDNNVQRIKMLAPSSLKMSDSPSSKNRILVKGKLPEGINIANNKVTIKKGYSLEKVSRSQVNLISRMRGGGITGSFNCTCNGNDGGCDVITTPSSVSCAKSTCKSSCYMIITIPGKAVKEFMYRAQ